MIFYLTHLLYYEFLKIQMKNAKKIKKIEKILSSQKKVVILRLNSCILIKPTMKTLIYRINKSQ